MRDRARYLFDRTLARSTGTLLGWLAACCLAVVLPVSALLVWTDPAAPRTLAGRLTAVWRTSAETLRLGGVTGEPLRMLLAGLLGLVALLCVSTLIGVITTGLGDRLTELRRGRSTVLEEDHAVVLGWSDQVFTVVAETVAAVAAAAAGGRRGVVAVLAEHDSAEMETALTAVLGDVGRARLVCRTGSPADPRALALVTPAAARSVLVLPSEDAGDGADVEVVRVLMALRALLGARPGPPVVAAVRDDRFLPAARLAAGPRGTVLETDLTTARLLAQSARRPGLSAALRDLLDFAGAEFHVVDVPELTGRSYDDIALCFEACCVVGFLKADGRPLLTPAPGTLFETGDRLVVVAPDEPAEPPADRRDLVEGALVTAPVPLRAAPVRVLLLGWNRRAPLLLGILRDTSPPGSVVDVVTDPDQAPGGVLEGDGAEESLQGAPARLLLNHHTGDLTRPEFLRALDVFGYDSVVVLGPDECTGTERPDDRTLLTLLMLRAREEEAGRALPVVAELRDPRSRALAPLGPSSDAVVRGELTALLMAQLSHSPELATVFDEIFAVRGGALALRPAGDYVRPGAETAFATVVAAALERGECALGYRVPAPPGAAPHGLRLCPGTSRRRVWDAQDEILVLTPGSVTTPATEPGGRGLPGMRGEPTGPVPTTTPGQNAQRPAPPELRSPAPRDQRSAGHGLEAAGREGEGAGDGHEGGEPWS
ncbi:NAD-binding lipoprotein [Streptomyces sp. NPDC089424]|uniref:CASTOR/POLLUX-related putative ion channel n=1 Tax=Streptomyces sp. NPDC089424 TaxID=3365917 RepID=UPI00380281C3